MDTVVSPMDWAQAQFGSCLLKDGRRTSRLVRVAGCMASRSSASVPKQMEDWAGIQGAYRLFGMEQVTHEAVSKPHWEATRQRARAPGLGVVLFIQDLTELDFGRKPDSYELGFVGRTLARGFEVQTTLCVVPSTLLDRADVLGLALQTPWTRDHAPRKKIEKDSERAKRRTEYDVWRESVEAIGRAPDPDSGTTWVSVGDRGSDVFSHLSAAHALGWQCLVRSKYNRKLSQDDAQEGLYGKVRALEPSGSTSISLRSRPGQKARTALLHVSFVRASLPCTSRSKGQPALEVNCVRVWEDPSTKASSPIEWILLTTLPAESFEQALRIVELYRHRWLVEEYHKCLKTGCQIENRNLNHKGKLLALLGVLGIVAVLLLQMKAPNESLKPCQELVSLVRLVTNAQEDLGKPSALLRRIAMLGGFIGRKGDGEPGWQTIWAGWTRIQDILLGIEIAKGQRCV